MKFRTLQELDHIQGSVVLIEASGNTTNPHAQRGHHGTDIVLVPRPTDDVNDPLNEPKAKKMVAFISICFFTFMTTASTGGLTPAFYILSLEFKRSIAETSGLLKLNFFWVAIALRIGKRPVFVFTLLVLTLTNMWSALAQSFNNLLAARIVMSFAGSATETLGAAIVNDLFFLHERGALMGVYIIFLAFGNSIGPMIAGFIISGAGWRWASWLWTILSALNLIMVVLFCPETRYHRDIDLTQDEAHESTKNSPSTPGPYQVNGKAKTTVQQQSAPSSKPMKTFLQELSLWYGVTRGSNFLNLTFRPFPLVVLPAIIFAFLSYAIALARSISSGTLNSFILQAPTYSWSPAINGLIAIPSIIGIVIGALAGGVFTDILSARKARSEKGVFTPESRLPLLIVPLILVPFGLLMLGFGAQYSLHWVVIFVGYGLINVGISSVANIGLLFVVDSYYPVASEALLLVNGLKNVFGFGFIYAVVPWVTADGYAKCYGALAGIFVAIICLGIPFLFFGARIRTFTSENLRIISW